MKVKFGTPKTTKNVRRLDTMREITQEVPVTILHEREEVSARAVHLSSPIRNFPLILPSGSVINVHDGTICEYRENLSNRFYERYDALITYIRPISRTQTKRLCHEFPIVFSD